MFVNDAGYANPLKILTEVVLCFLELFGCKHSNAACTKGHWRSIRKCVWLDLVFAFADKFDSDFVTQDILCGQCQEPCNETGFQYTFTHSSANFLDIGNAQVLDAALYANGINVVPPYYDVSNQFAVMDAVR